MHSKKRLAGILGLLVLLLGFWIWTQKLSGTDKVEEQFVLTAFSVGKADALLIQQGEQAVLVDTGEESAGPVLVQEMQDRGIDRLDLLLITHFDKDHVGSASYIMEHVDVDMVIMPDYEGDRPEYEAFLESLEGYDRAQRLDVQEHLILGDMTWTIYPAEDPEEILRSDAEYDNDLSLVASVTYGSRKFLLTGDIEKTRISQMLASDVDWNHDWIKMPHHGRYQKSLKKLLDAVQPSWAVICCSEEEPADDKTEKMLSDRRIPVWDTSVSSVVTVCDGEKIEINEAK